MRDVRNGDGFKKCKRKTLNDRNVLRPSAFPLELMTLSLWSLSALFPVWAGVGSLDRRQKGLGSHQIFSPNSVWQVKLGLTKITQRFTYIVRFYTEVWFLYNFPQVLSNLWLRRMFPVFCIDVPMEAKMAMLP